MALINIGSTVAFDAMLSLSTVALMATYVASIGCVTLKRIKKQPLPPARWSQGRSGLPVSYIAMEYACRAFSGVSGSTLTMLSPRNSTIHA